ncbi:hypothetical protein [Vibrio parahaemolyticus]|uniref:hypothetical protein n=1 Tax=Vibrio parahaemolyticus TaxID=670 RepID=UPI00329A1E77
MATLRQLITKPINKILDTELGDIFTACKRIVLRLLPFVIASVVLLGALYIKAEWSKSAKCEAQGISEKYCDQFLQYGD